jgi:hypothetical protein
MIYASIYWPRTKNILHISKIPKKGKYPKSNKISFMGMSSYCPRLMVIGWTRGSGGGP